MPINLNNIPGVTAPDPGLKDYWVLLEGRGQGQNLYIEQNGDRPTPSSPYMSFSVHGPYTLQQAANYAKSLGGETVDLVNSAGTPIGTVDVTKSVATQSGNIGPTVENTSGSSENARVKAAGGTTGTPLPSIPNPLDALKSIGDFFGRLTEASTWIRIGKVLVGGALLLIGLAHITGADNQIANAARNVKVLPI